MTASIRILTNASIDCNPSLLIVSPNGSKTLVNCSEGCQRSFLESASVNYGAAGAGVSSLRISSVNRVCLTHIGHDATGGLPGMILTTADVVDSVAREMANNSANKRTNNNNGGGGRGGGGRSNGNNNNNNQRQGNNNGRRNNNNNNRKRNGSLISDNNDDDGEEGMPDLEIVGPVGTKTVLHSLRHFMRRDRFKVHAHEGPYDSSRNSNSVSNNYTSKKKSKKKKFKGSIENDEIGFNVESIPVEYDADVDHYDMGDDDETPPQTKQVVSYLFTTTPIPGKFLVEKAQALNVPKGRMYGVLKGGKSVTFTDPTTNEERTVTSEEVVAKSSPGVGVAVIYCPTLRILSKLKEASALRAFENCNNNHTNDINNNGDNNGDSGNKKSDEGVVKLDVMVHLTPKSLFRNPAYRSWCETFGPNVDHVTLHTVETLEARAALPTNSPFVSGVYGGVRRSFVNDALFPRPSCTLPGSGGEVKSDRSAEEAGQRAAAAAEKCDEGEEGDSSSSPSLTTTNIIEGCPMMDYVLMPRSRRGLNESTLKCLYSTEKMERLEKKVNDCGAVECAVAATATAVGNPPVRGSDTNISNNGSGDHGGGGDGGGLGELIFTGTGSAVPCKHRNVTGMYLRMNNGNSMLLDVGEGTVGQLLHSWKSTLLSSSSSSTSSSSSGSDEKEKEVTLIDEYRTRLKGIKAVWISHPHADHHLGLLRLLSERTAVCGPGDPIVLMAPHDMFDFLAEYRRVAPELDYSYIPVDCNDMIHGRRNPLGDKLYDDLGITLCAAVPVAHCQRSYAVVVDGTSFGRVAYSGDCRPSNRFADVAYGADLLIHEATFEDGMEEDAVMKRHSTVGEAIGVAGKMNAGALVLTHFSQRYPKIPPLNERRCAKDEEGKEKKRIPIAFAFDFMRLAPHTIELAAKLTPALRLLYPGEEELEMDSTSNNAVTAKELMAVPGVFAAKGVL